MKLIEELEEISPHGLAKDILNDISYRVGIDLYALITAETSPNFNKLQEFKRHIVKDALIEFRTNKLNFLDADFGPDKRNDISLIETLVTAKTEPNWMFNPRDLPSIKNYQGKEVTRYLMRLTRCFEQMTQSISIDVFADKLLSGGLVALGAKAGHFTWQEWKNGYSVKHAMVTSIRRVGMSVIIAIAAIALATLVVWLVFIHRKNILQIVINESNKDLMLKNYNKEREEIFINSETIKNLIKGQEAVGATRLQIKGGYAGGASSNSFYYGGVCSVDKKSNDYETEGICILTPELV
ncbi:hypothetical protein [Aquimarina sp. I32.4]|uniref:hypothetical protein n=1 Tax=Aquimarina sp. I32.4 TaxID=2053903 RepID=UPI000CDEF910|nr:hypothetical protein [Aquimarina sp. I32.4]